MKRTLQLPVDSEKPDLGVVDMIEAYRELFERTGGREQIAILMMELLKGGNDGSDRIVTRQMVEKWFNQKRRTIPSGVLLVTLLTACCLIQEEIDAINKRNKRTTKYAQ